MYPKKPQEEHLQNNQMYPDQTDYGWGNQMYGGAFNQEEYPTTQQYYKNYGRKEPMNMESSGSNLFYPQENVDWSYNEPMQQNNYSSGSIPPQKYYNPGELNC